MQGASALEKILKKEVDPRIRVFVIWERVRFFDFGAPSTFTLRRIADVRVSQYWDKERLVSHLLGENDSSPVVWDYVAVYPKGTLWDQIPPKPIYFHVPVISGTEGLNDAIRPLLLAAAKRNLIVSHGLPQSSEKVCKRIPQVELVPMQHGYGTEHPARELFRSAPNDIQRRILISPVTPVLRQE